MKIAGLTIAMSAAAREHGEFTDAQIAGILITANQVDVDAGDLAAGQSQSAEIHSFAHRMITEHSEVNQSTLALLGRLHVTPEDSHVSQGLKIGSDENLETLKRLHGAAFDRAYVDHEVLVHEHVLEALDQVLIPNASDHDLKSLLIQIEPTFAAHLERAQQNEATLADKE
jgi:putative membrane protein